MQQDLDMLQGTWTVTALEVDGQSMAAPMLEDARLVIKGKRFTSTGMGAVYKGTVELNVSATPRELDMNFDAGPEKGNTNLAIYQLDGDMWKLCIATTGNIRPTGFVSKAGTGFALETLTRGDRRRTAKTRQRTPEKVIRAATPRTDGAVMTDFEGDWRMVSAVMDGALMDKSLVQWVKRVTRGNETTVYAGPQVMMRFEFTADSLTSPHIIDYVNSAGPNKGKTQHGIYEFEGNLLRICVAGPGALRPAQFESSPGDGRRLTVWQRVQPV